MSLATVRQLIDHVDLWICLVAALGALAAVVTEASPLVRAVLAVPLVLFLPGYAVVHALFPSPVIPAVERLLMSIGSSIGLTILISLLLTAIGPGLTPTTWAAALAVATITGTVVAWQRRLQHGVVGPGVAFATMPRIGAVMVLIAGFLIADVLLGNHLIARDQQTASPTQLWMVPVDDQANDARLGMRAGEEGGSFRIELSAAGSVLQEFKISLRPEQTWERLVTFAGNIRAQPIVARLYAGTSNSQLRFVVLQPRTVGEPASSTDGG